ncbi:MAG: hypothetical protein C4518_12790 [Desulfobacteraceae bacterium]|nr:MAG: hypothetical protein C4518_12790 [Desulfobacteraceae bacterium]
MFYMHKKRTLLFFLTTIFLWGLLIGCNESSSSKNSGSEITGSKDVENTWYKDADGDGYGDLATPLLQTVQPAGYVSNSGDCADYDATIYPGAAELCDGKDNNCNGVVDENACEPANQKISGRITNLNDAKAYITEASFLQIVPSDSQMVFTTDAQGRKTYTSNLAFIDIPTDGSFVFETYGLVPGRYVIAVQLLKPYGPQSDEIPFLATAKDQLAIIVIPESGDTPFEIDLGNVIIPTPEPADVTQTGSVLAAPNGVSATDGTFEDKIRVTWNVSQGATSYEVYRAASFAGQQVKVATTSATFYDDKGLPCGVDYYYWVKAKNASGASDLFFNDLGFIRCPTTEVIIPDEDTGEPGTDPDVPDVTEQPEVLVAPTGLAATDGLYPEKVTITWNEVTGATSYEVYRHSDCCGTRTKIGTTSATSFNDTLEDSLLPASIYYYWVKATNTKTTSSYSDRDSGYKLLKPLRPINVAASDGTYVGRIHVTWQPGKYPVTDLSCDNTCGGLARVDKVSEYEIYRSDWVKGTKTKIGTTTSTWFDDYDIPCSTCENIYYYWIVAKNAAGTSQYSDDDTGYAYRTLPDPNDIRATDGTIPYCVKIYWSSVAGAKSYDIFRSPSLDGIKTKIGSILADCGTCGTYTYLDTNPVCPEIYYYWVKSVDSKGYTGCRFYFNDTGYCAGD